MEATMKLEWGLYPPEGVETSAAWGARLIYEHMTKNPRKPITSRVANISIVGDRQGFAGEEEARKELGVLLRAHWTSIDKILQRFDSEGVISTKSDRTVVVLDHERFQVYVNPRGSHGYLYAGAYLKSVNG